MIEFMNSRERLNLIIPIYNPHPGWEAGFIRSLLKLKGEVTDAELKVILVNDGSTSQINNISEITDRLDFLSYYSYPVNMGKGYAIRYGINISDADYYIYTDMDFPFGYRIIYQTYQLLKSSKTNIVLGTRDASYFRMLPFDRRCYSVLLKKLNYLITGFRIKDTQAGLKGFDNKARVVLLNTKINTFLFELEFLKTSLRQGLSYEFIEIRCRPGIRFTNFRFRILFRETFCLLKLLFN